MKLAIILSQFNKDINEGLLSGAQEVLEENQIPQSQIEIFTVPGAFEIPLLAKECALSGRFDGIIALGSIIKGDTAHFEYISHATSSGLMNVMLETQIPISFGILTVYERRQALVRSEAASKMNKGREAATACLELTRLKKKFLKYKFGDGPPTR